MRGGVLWEASTVPGPTKLIGGNFQAGFYGEVPASEFITGDELASRIRLAAGVGQNSNEPWLKFSYFGKTEFIAKKPFRNSISWNDINNVNAVFGNRTIKIHGKTYKVRLMKAKTEGKQDDYSAYNGSVVYGSEWNNLFVPIHESTIPESRWGFGYTDNDLFTKDGVGNGTRSWCQEYGKSTAHRMIRGLSYLSDAGSLPPSYVDRKTGWRPVLELID